MVCDVVEIAAGVGAAWARRDGVGAVVVVVAAAVAPSVLSVLTALAPVDVAVLSSRVSAVAFVSAPCACCSTVA